MREMIDRPDWDYYFMKIAHEVSKRSLDPSSKFGCVAVSKGNSILSTGYNGPPKGVADSSIPLTRPAKYKYMEHAERNCIYNAARVGIPLENCTFYVTALSCVDCTRAMHQVGAKRIVMLNKEPSSFTEDWDELINFIRLYTEITIYEQEKYYGQG